MCVRYSVSHSFCWDSKYLTIQAVLMLLSAGNYGCINNSLAHCFTTSKLYNNFCGVCNVRARVRTPCMCAESTQPRQLKCKLSSYFSCCQKIIDGAQNYDNSALECTTSQHQQTDEQTRRQPYSVLTCMKVNMPKNWALEHNYSGNYISAIVIFNPSIRKIWMWVVTERVREWMCVCC